MRSSRLSSVAADQVPCLPHHHKLRAGTLRYRCTRETGKDRRIEEVDDEIRIVDALVYAVEGAMVGEAITGDR